PSRPTRRAGNADGSLPNLLPRGNRLPGGLSRRRASRRHPLRPRAAPGALPRVHAVPRELPRDRPAWSAGLRPRRPAPRGSPQRTRRGDPREPAFRVAPATGHSRAREPARIRRAVQAGGSPLSRLSWGSLSDPARPDGWHLPRRPDTYAPRR